MKILYVVLSRDKYTFIYCTHDKEKAEITKQEQINREEYGGGRPSVYILKTTIK